MARVTRCEGRFSCGMVQACSTLISLFISPLTATTLKATLREGLAATAASMVPR